MFDFDEGLAPLLSQTVDLSVLMKRISKKAHTYEYVKSLLVYLGHKAKSINGLDEVDELLMRQYERSLGCIHTIYKDNQDQIIKGNYYCERRFCLVCSNIRTAQFANKYNPIIEKWEDAHFLTLTVRNTTAANLPAVVAEMFAALQESKTGQRYEGIRKLEITYNEKYNDFHPHFHFILRTYEQACELRQRWLTVMASNVNEKAQQIPKKCDKKSLIELAKYFCKTEHKDKDQNIIHTHAVHTMYRAIVGRRVIQDMGMHKYFESEEQNLDIEDETLETPDTTETIPDNQDIYDVTQCNTEYTYVHENRMYINSWGEPLLNCHIKRKKYIYRHRHAGYWTRGRYELGVLNLREKKTRRKKKIQLDKNVKTVKVPYVSTDIDQRIYTVLDTIQSILNPCVDNREYFYTVDNGIEYTKYVGTLVQLTSNKMYYEMKSRQTQLFESVVNNKSVRKRKSWYEKHRNEKFTPESEKRQEFYRDLFSEPFTKATNNKIAKQSVRRRIDSTNVRNIYEKSKLIRSIAKKKHMKMIECLQNYSSYYDVCE